MPISFQTLKSLLDGAEIKLRVNVHGPVIDALVSSACIGDIERTEDGIACNLAFDGLSMLKQLCGILVEADVLDINIIAREDER